MRRAPGVRDCDARGERIGVIWMTEARANIGFGGATRNRLFMAGSQSRCAVYVGMAGAHIASTPA